jgi:hypothetical protein
MSNFSLISAISFALLISACSRANSVSNELRAGGLYSTEDGEGHFSVVKILVLEPDAVHIRIYKQRFPSRPASVDPASLTLGKFGDKDGFSIGHLPLSRRSFASWQPVFISQQSVSDGELEGYRTWKEAKGGIF